jgi:hypothetical protein
MQANHHPWQLSDHRTWLKRVGIGQSIVAPELPAGIWFFMGGPRLIRNRSGRRDGRPLRPRPPRRRITAKDPAGELEVYALTVVSGVAAIRTCRSGSPMSCPITGASTQTAISRFEQVWARILGFAFRAGWLSVLAILLLKDGPTVPNSQRLWRAQSLASLGLEMGAIVAVNRPPSTYSSGRAANTAIGRCCVSISIHSEGRS